MVSVTLLVRKVALYPRPVTAPPGAMLAWLPMALLTEAVPGGTESNYGWCGLCHCFTLFPHECPGAQKPAPEEAD